MGERKQGERGSPLPVFSLPSALSMRVPFFLVFEREF